MRLHELIRQYRKEQNLTQEQLANYLGVSAPAVNKWENASSYPDITLLPPLARILKTDVNTLLSFHEELTPTEINQYLMTLYTKLQSKDYEASFQYGEEMIREHSACDQLTLTITQLLYAYLNLLGVTDRSAYEEKILHWYELLIDSNKAEVKSAASGSLCNIYIEREEFEKAQQLIDSIPAPGYDKRNVQGALYVKQNNTDAAASLYEHMMYEFSNKTCSSILCMMQLCCQQGDFEAAAVYADLIKDTAKRFHLSNSMIYTPDLLLAAAMKDTEKCLTALDALINVLLEPGETSTSSLYPHMQVRHTDSDEVVKMLKDGIKSTDHSLDFLREDARFQKLLKRLG